MHRIIRLLDIARPSPNVDALTPIEHVSELFRSESEIAALPVIKDGSYVGLVSKSQLYKALSRTYALDVYRRRPVGSLLDKQAMPMNPQTDIHAALALLLKADPTLSIDSIPIVLDGNCMGIVSVSSLLMNISRSQSSLLKTLEELSHRIRDEVKKAAQIQQALLPLPIFRIHGIEKAADLRTCSEIGGDYYDYFPIDQDRLCMIIADVSGHGVQAGMITTAAKASLHTLVQQGVDTPGALLKAMNDSILATTQQALLMTCLVAVISPREQQIRYANAGHDFPYLCRKSTGTAELLENPASFPLGLDPNNIFYEMAAAFNPGDTFVLYSDGIHECTNGTEDFGHMRLERCLSSLIGQSPEEWVRHVLHALSEFRGDENLRDDVTLVVASLGDTI